MEAWMAFVSIMAIVAIVVVAGGLIAFIGHMIIGAFDNKQVSKKENKEVIDYAQYKQITSGNQGAENKEYDFAAINENKAQQEKELVEKQDDKLFELDIEDDDLAEIEQRLAAANEEKAEEPVVEPVEEDDSIDEFDLDSMLSEISEEVIEEEKTENTDEIKMSDELESYSIDEMLKRAAEEETEEDVAEESVEDDVVEEIPAVELEEDEDNEEGAESVDETLVEEEPIEVETEEEPVEEEKPQVNEEVESLKAQLAELNRQLEIARTAKVEVVKIDSTEEECVARLELLEERLKNVKKDYKINLKEYKPLKKVMTDLERYQTKLRRKEAIVAKKKVALYGVNNYVDIDKEKAEKLAEELELLDGLRLSVNHCEEVINANKDRFPILEHTNQILEDQIAHIEADIVATQETLNKIREGNGGNADNGENQ